MAKALPAKSKVTERETEEARRLDLNASGVAQEALDCVGELEAEGRSPSEVFLIYGYDPRIVKKAKVEENRIAQELKKKPSKDVPDTFLKVSDVKAKKGIAEFVPEPEEEEKEAPAPFVIEG